MKRIILALFFLANVLRGGAQKTTQPIFTNPIEKDNWELIWGDEFDGQTLDSIKWWPQKGTHGTELQYYTTRKENVYVKDGFLHIRTLRERLIDTLPFTSANVFSSVEFGKGNYIEIRCKIPKGKGLWPAFWFWSGRNKEYQEIDVFEYWCDDTRRFLISNFWQDTLTQKIKVQHNWIHPRSDEGKRLDMATQFMTYAVFWDDNGIHYLLNNRLIKVYKNNIPKRPFPIILNMAIQDGKKREPDINTIFPAEFLIDYVRVYKQKGTQTITH